MPSADTAAKVRTILTIGHSTRALEAFLGLLGEYGIEVIAGGDRGQVVFPNCWHSPLPIMEPHGPSGST